MIVKVLPQTYSFLAVLQARCARKGRARGGCTRMFACSAAHAPHAVRAPRGRCGVRFPRLRRAPDATRELGEFGAVCRKIACVHRAFTSRNACAQPEGGVMA
jgi:hypothetical protein